MKKMWTAVLVVGLIAAVVAIGQEVTSVNAVGFTKIDIGPGGLAFVAPVFESFGDSTVTDVVGDQLGNGSAAYIFDRVTKSYVPASKTKSGWIGDGATNILHRGDALWLFNGGVSTSTVSLMGEVPYTYNDGKTSTVYSINGTDAFGYAFPVDVVLTNTSLASAMANGDAVYLFNTATGQFDPYSKTKSGWLPTGNVTIEAGRAFFVFTSQNIDWTEIAPYDL